MAWQERPGPVHLELPEDAAAEAAPEMKPVPPHPIDLPIAQPAALDRAAGLIRNTERPRIMLGAAASRPRLAACLSDFVRRLQEKPPFLMGPKGPTALHVGYLPATVEEAISRMQSFSAMSARASPCWPTRARRVW